MKRIALPSICSLLLAACGAGGSVPKPPELAAASVSVADSATTSASGQTCGLDNFQQELMNRINQARANSRMCGSTFFDAAPALQWNAKLFNAAAEHSNDMATKNYFSHIGQDGRTFDQRITAAGYAWRAAAENIAAGQTTAEQAVNGWLNSPGHCASLMNSSYVDVGVACVKNDSATYQYYWTMELARPA